MPGVLSSWIVSGIVGYIVADFLVYTPIWDLVNPKTNYTNYTRIFLFIVSALFGWIAFTIHAIIVILWTNLDE